VDAKQPPQDLNQQLIFQDFLRAFEDHRHFQKLSSPWICSF